VTADEGGPPTYRCIDFGYRSPACAWLQVSPKGQWFVVAELAPHELRRHSRRPREGARVVCGARRNARARHDPPAPK